MIPRQEFCWIVQVSLRFKSHCSHLLSHTDLYRAYQIFITLLKLDVFFVFGFGLQFLVLVIKTNDPEFALTIAALPVMVAILALAVYGVRSLTFAIRTRKISE